ncbi:protein YlqD [Candidatus Termititenax persephonae]|uniref:Protein YlqD n=1 Tax=Candidatus Termititenax persephonae TaxID=2218525 RepID=A0A388TFY5_9BACT|nr:protein YlqD [Candidatus Termititenax persephonae]
MAELSLQRNVTVKVTVTEEFKKYLVSELERSIKNMETQLTTMETQGKRLVENLKKQGEKTVKQISAIVQQINMDKQQAVLAKVDLEKKIAEAKELKLGSEFLQGTVQGTTTVKEGDNLYKKLGGIELLLKDGVIQEIRGV